MIAGEGRKLRRYQNQSLMTLNSNSQPETTKKSIEADELCNFQPTALTNNRKFIFSLPFSTQIATIFASLTLKFASSLLHTQSDTKSALLVLEGLKIKGIRRTLGKLMDYLIFCCSRGMKYGPLQESYNVVVITIKREVIDNRCLISVSNPYPTQCLLQFTNEVLEPIQEQLRALGKQLEVPQDGNLRIKNACLDEDSPSQLEIQVQRKIYHIFVHSEHKQLEKYKSYLQNSLQIIRSERERHIDQLRQCLVKNNMPSPAGLVEVFVLESENLMAGLQSSYKQQENHRGSYLYSLLAFQCVQEITLYKIQQILCLYQLPFVKEIYLKHTQQQCEAFNSNMTYVNTEFSDQDCFEHLELRYKYRLPSQKRAYHSAIEQLKQIQYCLSLREMLLIIQQCFSSVKSDCLVAYGGKEELGSMDDLLPVMIFVVVRAGVNNFPLFAKLVDDYVRFKNIFELEERIITTIQVAVQDISRKWSKKQGKQGILNENS